MIIKQSVMEPIPADSNPFLSDTFNMGLSFGKDLIIMHGNHPAEICRYIILVNTKTGQRIKLDIDMDGLE